MQKKLYLYLLPLLLAATPLAALTSKKAKIEKKKKFVAPDAEIKTLETSPFKDIAHEYMKGFTAPEEDEDDIQQKKLRTEIPQISEYALFTHIFNLYQTVELTPQPIFNKNGWKDLELLCGDHKEHVNLVYFLNRTQTKLGQSYLGYLLSYPIGDTTALQNRQNVVKEFVSNKALSCTCKKALADVAAVENNLFFFWETENEFNLKAISSYFFTSNLPGLKKLKKINTNPRVMEALHFNNHLISCAKILFLPALYTYAIKKLHPYERELTYTDAAKKVGKNFPRDLETLFSLQGLVYSLEFLPLRSAYLSETSYNDTTNYLHGQMMTVGTVIHAMQTLSSEIKNNETLQKGLDHQKQLTALFDAQSALTTQKMHKLVALLLSDTFTGKPSYFCFKGRVLAAYALMKEIKNDLAPALLALGEIDTYLSSATLYEEYQDKPNGFCFVDYLIQDSPYIKLDGMWNPFIPSKKAVANSIELGGTKPLNIILTGPNAGGKSTFSKGLTLNVLLAQTIGIVPGLKLELTPFEKINTYMNITDDTAGGNSLFKSEVLRAQSLLKTIADLDKKKFSFSIMDEMFSGTSPREGEAAGYAVAKNLGANTNSIAVIATHFPKLKELEKTTGNFKNYQVRVAYAADGSFTYPFKLEEGAADQNVAIAILQQQGFDSSILDEVQAILKDNSKTTAAAA